MLRHAWKPIAASVVVGTPAYLVYRRYSQVKTFEIPVRVKGSSGKSEMSTKTVTMLPLQELEARINENAVLHTTTRPNGIAWKHTTATLASNNPIEDANAHQLIERDASDPSGPGDYVFFAVMDGHGGFDTSRLLSKTLIKGVALELANLISNSSATPPLGLMNRVKSLLGSYPSLQSSIATPDKVAHAIETAFVNLDKELLQTPLRILANSMDQEAYKTKTIPDLSKHPLALTAMKPAISGI